MAPERRGSWVEMDRNNRPRHVRGYRRPSSDADLLSMAEDEIDMLRAENASLLDRIRDVEYTKDNCRKTLQALNAEHNHCPAKILALQDRLRAMQDKYEDEKMERRAVEDELKLVRRMSHQENWKQRYEDAVKEIDGKKELMRMDERKIADLNRLLDSRDRTIAGMRNQISRLGYRYIED